MSNIIVEPPNNIKTKRALDIVAGDTLMTFFGEEVVITDVNIKVSGIFEFVIAQYSTGFFCLHCEQAVTIK